MQTAQKDGASTAETTDPWMSMPAAARALATTRFSVLQLIADGVLEQQVVGGIRFVSRRSVDARRDAQAVEGN